MPTLNAVIFREHAHKNFGGKFVSLFPGLGYAAGYSTFACISTPRQHSLTPHRGAATDMCALHLLEFDWRAD